MRILVTDPIADAGIELLRGQHHVDVAAIDGEDLVGQIPGYHGLVVRSGTQVDERVFEAGAPVLRAVVRAGVGLDNVDVEAATRHGVVVCNTPGSNSVSAAEHTLGLVLAAARHVPAADRALRSGSWERARWRGRELHGSVLGILGLGRIGSLVASRARAFGMEVIAHDPYVTPAHADELGVDLRPDLDDLLAAADIVSVHLPLTPDTNGLLDAGRIASMKRSAILVNVARGGIVDEEALAEAVREGRLAGAAVDVFAQEPVTHSPLFDLDEVVVTPHLGASTTQAQHRAGVRAAEAMRDALAGQVPATAVNLGGTVEDSTVRRYLDMAGQLGRLASHLTPDGTVGTVVVEYGGTLADHDCRILGRAVLQGVLGSIADTPVSLVNAPLLAEDRGLGVREIHDPATRDHAAVLRVSAVGRDGRAARAAGTVTSDGGARLVEVWDTPVDLVPTNHVAMLVYEDRPGVIGTVGTVLGAAGVNIASAHVGRREGDGEAVMVLCLDGELPQSLLHTIADATAARAARYARLR